MIFIPCGFKTYYGDFWGITSYVYNKAKSPIPGTFYFFIVFFCIFIVFSAYGIFCDTIQKLLDMRYNHHYS